MKREGEASLGHVSFSPIFAICFKFASSLDLSTPYPRRIPKPAAFSKITLNIYAKQS
jgi:hypothetical protein